MNREAAGTWIVLLLATTVSATILLAAYSLTQHPTAPNSEQAELRSKMIDLVVFIAGTVSGYVLGSVTREAKP